MVCMVPRASQTCDLPWHQLIHCYVALAKQGLAPLGLSFSGHKQECLCSSMSCWGYTGSHQNRGRG